MLAMPAFSRATAPSGSLAGSSIVSHGQAHPLLILKAQVACGLEDAAGVNGLNLLGHFMLLGPVSDESGADATLEERS